MLSFAAVATARGVQPPALSIPTPPLPAVNRIPGRPHGPAPATPPSRAGRRPVSTRRRRDSGATATTVGTPSHRRRRGTGTPTAGTPRRDPLASVGPDAVAAVLEQPASRRSDADLAGVAKFVSTGIDHRALRALFCDVPFRLLAELMRECTRVTVPAGGVLVHQGCSSQCVWVVLSGRLQVFVRPWDLQEEFSANPDAARATAVPPHLRGRLTEVLRPGGVVHADVVLNNTPLRAAASVLGYSDADADTPGGPAVVLQLDRGAYNRLCCAGDMHEVASKCRLVASSALGCTWPGAALIRFVVGCRTVKLRQSSILVPAGSASRTLYVVASGRLREVQAVRTRMPGGALQRLEVDVGLWGPLQVVGERLWVSPKDSVHPTLLRADVDTTVVEVPELALHDLLATVDDPEGVEAAAMQRLVALFQEKETFRQHRLAVAAANPVVGGVRLTRRLMASMRFRCPACTRAGHHGGKLCPVVAAAARQAQFACASPGRKAFKSPPRRRAAGAPSAVTRATATPRTPGSPASAPRPMSMSPPSATATVRGAKEAAGSVRLPTVPTVRRSESVSGRSSARLAPRSRLVPSWSQRFGARSAAAVRWPALLPSNTGPTLPPPEPDTPATDTLLASLTPLHMTSPPRVPPRRPSHAAAARSRAAGKAVLRPRRLAALANPLVSQRDARRADAALRRAFAGSVHLSASEHKAMMRRNLGNIHDYSSLQAVRRRCVLQQLGKQ